MQSFSNVDHRCPVFAAPTVWPRARKSGSSPAKAVISATRLAHNVRAGHLSTTWWLYSPREGDPLTAFSCGRCCAAIRLLERPGYTLKQLCSNGFLIPTNSRMMGFWFLISVGDKVMMGHFVSFSHEMTDGTRLGFSSHICIVTSALGFNHQSPHSSFQHKPARSPPRINQFPSCTSLYTNPRDRAVVSESP